MLCSVLYIAVADYIPVHILTVMPMMTASIENIIGYQ